MNIASKIDHTLLKADSRDEEIEKLCKEARKYNFAAVCVNPYYVKKSSNLLKESNVKVATVVGFPLGSNTTEVKVMEARKAIEDGADEIDMVINISALKNRDYKIVKDDIEEVVEALEGKATVKVIIETCLLTEEEKIKACQISKEAGANYVKTSTGFNGPGAKVEDVVLMKDVIGSDMKIKASGGIRDFKTAKAMVDAGADRIGASSSVEIIKTTSKS